MKKFLVAVLTLVMMLAIAVTASAASTVEYYIYNVPCQAISDSQIYNYHGDEDHGATKQGYDKSIYIKHEVLQNDADETNRVAAYNCVTNKTMGANWHPADYCFYPCTSNAVTQYDSYTAAARGNTNYQSKYGLNTITLHGFVDADYD